MSSPVNRTPGTSISLMTVKANSCVRTSIKDLICLFNRSIAAPFKDQEPCRLFEVRRRRHEHWNGAAAGGFAKNSIFPRRMPLVSHPSGVAKKRRRTCQCRLLRTGANFIPRRRQRPHKFYNSSTSRAPSSWGLRLDASRWFCAGREVGVLRDLKQDNSRGLHRTGLLALWL